MACSRGRPPMSCNSAAIATAAQSPQSTHWWAAVVGYKAASAIMIVGPGEGVSRGYVPGPPRVP